MTFDTTLVFAALTAEVVATARSHVRRPVTDDQLERQARQALAGLLATRPKVIDFLPALALRRVIDRSRSATPPSSRDGR